jgi:hypothetical protein
VVDFVRLPLQRIVWRGRKTLSGIQGELVFWGSGLEKFHCSLYESFNISNECSLWQDLSLHMKHFEFVILTLVCDLFLKTLGPGHNFWMWYKNLKFYARTHFLWQQNLWHADLDTKIFNLVTFDTKIFDLVSFGTKIFDPVTSSTWWPLSSRYLTLWPLRPRSLT